MKKYTADWVYPVSAKPIPNGVVVIDDAGKILAVDSANKHNDGVVRLKGIIVPGLVNTHCHLELSHMLGKVNTGTGLIPFITGVVTTRDASEAVIQKSIIEADQAMYDSGIVAVGDISNKTDTFPVKYASKMQYYTFVEMFDFLQDGGAKAAYEQWKQVYNVLIASEKNKKTMVPHAPYSVSKSLFKLLHKATPPSGATVSIHNQETPPENELFLHKKGDFLQFYKGFNISLEKFKATKKTSIHYALQYLNPKNRTIFVHNTLTSDADLKAAQAWSKHTYWATCPNANLYIENRLPNYKIFMENKAKVTIGTDSLTSNWQLSILEEMKTIARYASYVPFDQLLQWATLNGALALGMEKQLGSLEVGKTPGLVLIEGYQPEHGNIGKEARSQRL